MKSLTGKLSEIYNFRVIDNRLGTAGQPTGGQLRMIREAGFKVVINLALPTSDNALAIEGSIVTGLGMSYVHIPVDFRAPTAQDFQTFCHVMGAFDDRPVFVHCAANMRVSAFVFLYRVLKQAVAIEEAEPDLHAIWKPDEVWSLFIRERLKTHSEQTRMKKLQEQVGVFVAKNHIETDVAHRLLDVMSELGEVAKEVLKGSRYGSSDFVRTKEWEEELGDVLFSLMCIANTTGVDLVAATEGALRKYEGRIAAKGSASSSQ